MPIRLKLLAALGVPLVLLLGFVYFKVSHATQLQNRLNGQATLVDATTGPSGVLTSLQAERDLALYSLLGVQDQVGLADATQQEVRQDTDAAIGRFEAALVGQSRLGEAYAPAVDALDDLAAARDETDAQLDAVGTGDGDTASAEASFVRYADIIGGMIDADARASVDIVEPDLHTGSTLTDLASRQDEVIADLALTLLPQSRAGSQVEVVTLGALEQRWTDQAVQIKQRGVEPYHTLVDDGFPQAFTEETSAFIADTLASGTADVDRLLTLLSTPPGDTYDGFRVATVSILDDEASNLVSEADQSQRNYLVLALVVLIATLAGVVWVSRSITGPLQSLMHQAGTMAHERLPEAVQDILETPLGQDVSVPEIEPIRVQTRDEVADVAQALNTVQDSAVDLAVEQAVLRRNIADSFVNLGHRNQNLLGRQLDFITELEQHETDPDTLANLFRLDHLATRMRRNAESLLVLAGIEPPRQWAAPVRLTDVIRAALGEVEDYQRVTVRAVEATTIIGGAAADLAHLLAELIENALSFSPPDQTVELRGRNQPVGHPSEAATPGRQRKRSYVLTVADSGLGMPPEEITRANRRLAGTESFTIAPSKYLGHYVAGNLAARHNINVQLHSSPGQGITATVHIPPELLSDEAVDDSIDDYAPGAPYLRESTNPEGMPTQPPTAAPEPASIPGSDAPPTPAPGTPVPVPVAQLADEPANGAANDPAEQLTTSGLAKRAPRSEPQRRSRSDRLPSQPLGATPDNDLLARLAQVRPTAPLSSLAPPGGPAPANPGPAPATPTSPPPPPPVSPPAWSSLAPMAPPFGSLPWDNVPKPSAPPVLPRDVPQPVEQGQSRARRLSGPPKLRGPLTRRSRGAHLPQSTPLHIDRGTSPGAEATPSEADEAGRPWYDNGEGTSPDNVQDFLANFHQGVVRGLNESRQPEVPPEEDSVDRYDP